MLEAMTNLTIFPKSLLILSIDFLTFFLSLSFSFHYFCRSFCYPKV